MALKEIYFDPWPAARQNFASQSPDFPQWEYPQAEKIGGIFRSQPTVSSPTLITQVQFQYVMQDLWLYGVQQICGFRIFEVGPEIGLLKFFKNMH